MNTLKLTMALSLALWPLSSLGAQENARPDYEAVSAATASVADAYYEAYVANDWDRLESLLHDDASFDDPTSQLIFGGEVVEGKEAMMSFFRSAYEGIIDAEFVPLRTFPSGNHAVYEGSLTWSVMVGGDLPVTSTIPVVTMLQQRDGKIISHRDYADYAPFLAAVRAARASSAEAAPSGTGAAAATSH